MLLLRYRNLALKWHPLRCDEADAQTYLDELNTLTGVQALVNSQPRGYEHVQVEWENLPECDLSFSRTETGPSYPWWTYQGVSPFCGATLRDPFTGLHGYDCDLNIGVQFNRICWCSASMRSSMPPRKQYRLMSTSRVCPRRWMRPAICTCIY